MINKVSLASDLHRSAADSRSMVGKSLKVGTTVDQWDGQVRSRAHDSVLPSDNERLTLI